MKITGTTLALAILSLLAASPRPALAQQPAPPKILSAKMTHCPMFTASKWTNPDLNPTTGNRYELLLVGETDCANATSWAQKLIKGTVPGTVQHQVSGGPPGYACYITPDGHGGALSGSCQKRDGSGSLVSTFDWTAGNE